MSAKPYANVVQKAFDLSDRAHRRAVRTDLWGLYATQKASWLSGHRGATPEAYKAAMRAILDKLGLPHTADLA